ncbi:MAG: transposase [Planctomycetes bacterium]|nr:transposase [Planctomycetota bacterium]
MPRTARASVGGICYHVINRGNGKEKVFHKQADYAAFIKLMTEGHKRLPMRVVGFCLMPNHFHLVLWPVADGDLSRWMQWLMTSHVRRYHRHYESSGHVWQGRFKAFPIQHDEHLLTVLRYVERNPLRAALVKQAEQWEWSSLRWWERADRPAFLHDGPVDRGQRWTGDVNRPMTPAEEEAICRSINRGAPWGSETWQKRIAARLGLESSLRPRGRPRKAMKK